MLECAFQRDALTARSSSRADRAEMSASPSGTPPGPMSYPSSCRQHTLTVTTSAGTHTPPRATQQKVNERGGTSSLK
eukprot:8436173-Pyramimonas_sp.AAC.1